ncbi:MAG: hypothetical protein H7282_15405 [Cytophagaceae bacterium]|nr:hypothetical protein [Cytophagaceae bacterium]
MSKYSFNYLEKIFFFLIVILNLMPILSGTFFPSLDGPAHLYNAQIIHSLLLDGHSQLNSFFSLNPEPVPNWIGHFILVCCNLFFSAEISEKTLVLLYAVGLPIVFRSFIKAVSPQNILFSYFIFPFTYSFVFMIGFYNFSIALIFLFITLTYWIKHNTANFSIKRAVILFLLVALTYFSHILVFVLLLLFLGIYTATKLVISVLQNRSSLKVPLVLAFKEAGAFAISSFLPIILFCYYFFSRTSGDGFYIPTLELISWLKNLRPIISYSFEKEEAFTQSIVYLIVSLLLIAVYNKLTKIVWRSDLSLQSNLLLISKKIRMVSVFFFLSTVMLFVLYFKLPDSDGSSGFVSVRLALLIFVFLICWLSTQYFPRWVLMLLVVVVLYCNFNLNNYRISVIRNLDEVALDCYSSAKYIAPNSVILPLNYSDNWLQLHFSNYLGIDKPVVILENYECGTGYFPVNWNAQTPNVSLGNSNMSEFPCQQWRGNDSRILERIDYVFVLGDMNSKTDSCNAILQLTIKENYTLVNQSKYARLYELKKQ